MGDTNKISQLEAIEAELVHGITDYLGDKYLPNPGQALPSYMGHVVGLEVSLSFGLNILGPRPSSLQQP